MQAMHAAAISVPPRAPCRAAPRGFPVRLLALLAAALACLLWQPAAAAPAGGAPGLIVTPTRIVLQGRTRSAELTLLNTGDAPATYRLSLVNMRMTGDGVLEPATERREGERFADRMIRFAPRQVTLAPGTPQRVRLLLRRPADLPPGEYRTHLLIRTLPEVGAGRDIETLAGAERGIKLRLIQVFGVSVPVIVRHGPLAASVAISEVALRRRQRRLTLELTRTGERSVYGDITAVYQRAGGPPLAVGEVRGIAVYTPNRERTVALPLRPPAGVRFDRGRILVTYRTPAEEGGQVLAETAIAVP